jgi:16S rRNA C967 or C1407 C5-methylase (RsmB/RsmF family)
LKENKVISNNIGKYSLCEGFGEFKYCVRVDPRKKETDGFFVAIFAHKPKQSSQDEQN